MRGDWDIHRDRRRDGVDRVALVLGVILVGMGLAVVGFFVFISVALQSWGSNK